MRVIAHRVFADNRPIELPRFGGALPPDGVELDIRVDADGRPQVYHGPVFKFRSARRVQIPKSLQAAAHFLTTEVPGLECLMLDIKSAAAADAVGQFIAKHPQELSLVFNCWHEDDVAILRSYLPDATIYYCIVPIFSRRVPKGRLRDLFVCNSYPFVTSRRSFMPRHGKDNQHNVNVKLIPARRLSMHLPRDIDGICLHKLFFSDEIAEFAAGRGLGLSVYGLSHKNKRRLSRIADAADYAIIGLPRPRRFRLPSNNRDKAM